MKENNLNESKPQKHGRSVLSRTLIGAGCLAIIACLCILTVFLINKNRHVVIEPYDIPQKVNRTSEQWEEEMIVSGNLNSLYSKLHSHWGGDCPDYYGGAYIEDRILHIEVTCDPRDVRDEIISATGSSDIDILQVEYSYNELIELKNKTSKIWSDLVRENDERAMYLSGMGLDEKRNRIQIDLFENDQEKADLVASLLGVRSDNRVRFVYAPYRVSAD
ncbi:MAG: hypothetical protein K6E95_08340 [Lachnospiraceae bacterium]|nr:hypothetical protein [Lachnospiraceae bacterium]